MLYLRFFNKKTPVPADVTIIKDGVVKVSLLDSGKVNLSGFKLYTDLQMQHLVGDYTAYKAKYRDADGNCMYLSTGEVYTAPPEPEPIPEPELTPEEIAEAERRENITGIQVQIAGLKAQIENTDYRIIKAFEYSLVGLETDYDIASLHEERQAARDEINRLEAELKTLMEGQPADAGFSL